MHWTKNGVAITIYWMIMLENNGKYSDICYTSRKNWNQLIKVSNTFRIND